jgi:hypothetical protein
MLQTLIRGEQSMSARMNIDTEGEGERDKERERGKHISGDPGRFDPDPHTSTGVWGYQKGDKT